MSQWLHRLMLRAHKAYGHTGFYMQGQKIVFTQIFTFCLKMPDGKQHQVSLFIRLHRWKITSMVWDAALRSVSMSDCAYCHKRLSGVVQGYACACTTTNACPHGRRQTDDLSPIAEYHECGGCKACHVCSQL